MKMRHLIVLILTTCLCLGLAAHVNADQESSAQAEKATQAAPAKPMRLSTKPAEPPKTPGNITSVPSVQLSAACCTKQCPGGGTCGQDCDVVDKLSQCSSNISFECPSNKGLTCVTGTCTCE